jgi:hypothetical protein
MGWGKVRNRKVFVTADDFSVRGGHADGGIHRKAGYGEVKHILFQIDINLFIIRLTARI